uniref:CUT domain-containing protein n=1 Tax=Ditylenchus dipsaci TaxID=166011 RepID=A0A915EFN0_9BILA
MIEYGSSSSSQHVNNTMVYNNSTGNGCNNTGISSIRVVSNGNNSNNGYLHHHLPSTASGNSSNCIPQYIVTTSYDQMVLRTPKVEKVYPTHQHNGNPSSVYNSFNASSGPANDSRIEQQQQFMENSTNLDTNVVFNNGNHHNLVVNKCSPPCPTTPSSLMEQQQNHQLQITSYNEYQQQQSINLNGVEHPELAQRISQELKRYSIPQAIFAQRVLCRSQGTLSDLLRNPKPWSKLKSGRETFRRMAKWLQEPEFQECLLFDSLHANEKKSSM